MSEAAVDSQQVSPLAEKPPSPALETLSRIAKYTGMRLVVLFLTVVVAIFLTILIANMGGYVDNIRRGEIRETVQQTFRSNRALAELPQDVREARMQELIATMEHQQGLDRPFIVRTVSFLKNALTLQLGRASRMASASGSNQVRLIILERLPSTLVLFGIADLILFFLSVGMALGLSRRYGSFWDKAIVALSPSSAAPGWFYGIFLILVFAAILRLLPFGGMVAAPVPNNPWDYFLSLLKHLILPVTALTISQLFLSAFNWRTFFLIYSSEDYVEMAKAKGLTSRSLERRYIMRPTMPTIITNFALLMIYSWTGAPIFETIFQWPGLGRVTVLAIGLYDTAVIVGSTVVFAYLLAITAFLLEIIYVLVDPRVKIGGSGSATT
ncbi:MAG: ABC transporter permease [Anaerolineales bacterium]|nr:ABC transporter permease [Anaerolineales bacterium]